MNHKQNMVLGRGDFTYPVIPDFNETTAGMRSRSILQGFR